MTRRLSLSRDTRGATIVEFAMILPVLCALLLGIFDLGYRAYVSSIVQGALHEAARMATVGGVTNDEIDAHVQRRLRTFAQNAEIETETQSYREFANVSQAERVTQDNAPVGVFNYPGDCFEDVNNNGTRDMDQGRDGVGGAEDVVRYSVSMTYPHIFPVSRILGWEDDVTINASTVLRNQPYAARSTAVVIRC